MQGPPQLHHYWAATPIGPSCEVTANAAVIVVSGTKNRIMSSLVGGRPPSLGESKCSILLAIPSTYIDRYRVSCTHMYTLAMAINPSGTPTTHWHSDHQMTAPNVRDISPSTWSCTCPLRHCWNKSRSIRHSRIASWNAWLGRTSVRLRWTTNTYHESIACPYHAVYHQGKAGQDQVQYVVFVRGMLCHVTLLDLMWRCMPLWYRLTNHTHDTDHISTKITTGTYFCSDPSGGWGGGS